MSLILEHSEFVRALDAREIKVLMHPRQALQICDRFPETFGRSWDWQRGCGCAPYIILLALPWWIDLPWYGWLVAFVIAWILGSSFYKGMTQTAIDSVVLHAREDAVFYESLVLNNAITVKWTNQMS